MAHVAQPGLVIVGRYRLVKRLGAGGFGQVWQACDETLDIDVAIKGIWLPPASSAKEHDERQRRAAREAHNAAKLRDHPNIVTVHDVVIDDGTPWIVMQFVSGRSLQQVLESDGPLPVARAAEVARALLSALAGAHAAGVVHRDVKPGNVMLADNGEVLLTDFGIALHHTDTSLTSSGMLIGSAEYMAPERLAGTDGLPASDLFSLGVTLYQAVENVSPFRRDTPVATLAAVANTPAPPPAHAGRLAPLITRLLVKDPATRADSTEALALLDNPATLPQPPQPEWPVSPPYPSTRRWVTAPAIRGPAMRSGVWRAPRTTRSDGGAALVAALAVLLVVGLVTAGVIEIGAHSGLFSLSNGAGGGGNPTTQPNYAPTYLPTAVATMPPDLLPTLAPTQQPTQQPTQPPTTVPTFDPTELNNESTDTTPATPAAVLPSSFVDSLGISYHLASAGTTPCTKYLSPDVADVVSELGCGNQIHGAYVGTAGGIMVSVSVIPMTAIQGATTAYDELKNDPASHWGIWCPGTGPGSQICADDEDFSTATLYGYTTYSHRYFIHTMALYTNLSDSANVAPYLNYLTQASYTASISVGPLNYWGNH